MISFKPLSNFPVFSSLKFTLNLVTGSREAISLSDPLGMPFGKVRFSCRISVKCKSKFQPWLRALHLSTATAPASTEFTPVAFQGWSWSWRKDVDGLGVGAKNSSIVFEEWKWGWDGDGVQCLPPSLQYSLFLP